MAVLDIFAPQQLIRDIEDSLAGPFRGSDEERIGSIRKFLLNGQACFTQNL
jgi:hypothetical protein